MSALENTHTKYVPPDIRRRAVLACFIGNFVEWFDYASYGYLAAVIAHVFFPEADPKTGLMAAFAVFAVSFIIRPIGGLFWGHIGDKMGRRQALAVSILIMSASTFLIALLPGYAQIGLAAPLLLLLLRIVQGFSASGEYAGAAAFLAEYAPPGRRGRYVSVVPASTASGLLLGSVIVAGLTATLSADDMSSWGWRLPFLLAAPLGLIGRYIRTKLEDTPAFVEMEENSEVQVTPLRELFADHKRAMLIGLGVTLLNAVGFYMLLSYMPTYLHTELGMGATESFVATTVTLVAYIFLIFAMGALSDHWGRKRTLIAACVLFAVFSVPLFALLDGAGLVGAILIQIGLGALLTMNDGTLGSFLSELFPTTVRYSGFAFSFNLANAIFGGTAPFVATFLIAATGSRLAPAWYLVAAAIVAMVAMLAAKETSKGALRQT